MPKPEVMTKAGYMTGLAWEADIIVIELRLLGGARRGPFVIRPLPSDNDYSIKVPYK